MSFLFTLLTTLFIPLLVSAHMELIWPIPFNSKFDASYYGNSVDWTNTAPLLTDGSNFPCKHYHLQNHNKVQASYVAGGNYNISLTGYATHSGGSCQISLSYDNGQSFQVLKSMIGGCPLKSNWNFTIPSDAPSKPDALLAWSWFNLIGNREMYMNCVRVSVQGTGHNSTVIRTSPSQRRQKRLAGMQTQKQKRDQKLMTFTGIGIGAFGAYNGSNSTAGFSTLPPMFACDVGNNCTTVEKKEVVFPKLGDVVEYGVDAETPDPGPGFIISS